jgi:putative hydrolase of the HAD superfamily
MDKINRLILWDFEGTLVDRPGRWRSALMEVLDTHEPGHQVGMEQIRPFLKDGFPWHRPDEVHIHLNQPDEWWSQVGQLFTRAYEGVGFSSSRAKELSSYVRDVFINPDRFIIYEDTIPALTTLHEKGWRHAVLSNHVPELQNIVTKLGLDPYFEYCFTSGVTGYEKPNPKAFQFALQGTGQPGEVWMIGDNVDADVRGAEAIGIRAILVRDIENTIAKYYAQNLNEAVSIIIETDN